jgi:signal transduction histidine kinase
VDVADDVARLTVHDNGRGFDVDAAERETRGAGLFGMRERLALMRGEMSIISRAGEGTRLSITVPLEQARSV